MDKLKRCRNQNSLTNTFAISVTITLLTFSALTIDPLLVLATGEVVDEEENKNVNSSVNNGNGHLSSSPLPSPSSQQDMNTDIIDSKWQCGLAEPIYSIFFAGTTVRVTNSRNYNKCCPVDKS